MQLSLARMDRFFASLVVAWLTIQLDGTIAARDCLQCWRDVCGPGFSPDTSFSSDCCDCIDMQGECIANAVSVSPSSDCCSIAETNLLSVFTLESGEESDACTDSHVFNSPGQLKDAVDTANTLQPGAYIIPSFTFECSGCIKEVLVKGLITLPGFIPENDIITIGLQIWSHFDPPSDQNDLHRMIHNVSTSRTDIKTDSIAAGLYTITFNLLESNQICFNDGEVFGLTVDGSEGLKILLENRDNQRIYDVSSSSSATCSNLDDLVILTPETQSYSGVPLVAVNIVPPPIASTSIEVVPATPSVATPRSTESGRVTTDAPGLTTPMASPPSSNPTSDSNIETRYTTYIVIGGVGGGVITVLIVCIGLLVVGIILWTRNKYNKQQTDGAHKSGQQIVRVRSRRMEQRLNSHSSGVELVPVGASVDPFYDYPHAQVHQYHELERTQQPLPGPDSSFSPTSSGKYTTMLPVGSVREGAITPVSNGGFSNVHTIYDEDAVSHADSHTAELPNPQVQDMPFYHTLEQPAKINGQMVPEVGYDVPVELLQRQESVEDIDNPVYNEIERGPQQHLQIVDPATGHPYHMLEDKVEKTSSDAGSVEEHGLYVPTAEERRRISYRQNTTEISAGDIESWIKKSQLESTMKRRFFEATSTYWDPPSKVDQLYNTLAKRKYREILSDQIQIIKYIGHGQFGTVNLSVWKQDYVEPMEVAVKVCRAGANESVKTKFLKEAAIMGQFRHVNVVKLYGVITMSEQPKIVLELMKNGDLLTYMEKNFEPGKMPPPTPLRLMSFSRQVACGMNYLSNKAFVHRDLAARNVLINELHQCKIGDFGMARDLEDSEYYIMSRKGPLPLKWTAPEALNFRKYSSFSDCYSYGMVLYEIWSVGREPLPDISIKQVPDLVTKGYCQAPPPGCPRAIYDLMVKLWNPKKRQRPPFSAIVEYLKRSDEELLAWSEEDRTVSTHAAMLGAPLEEAKQLYFTLQNIYQSSWC